MTKLVDPDDLNQNTEVVITLGTSGTIQLVPTGNLDEHDGVTGQCVYSFLKEEWRTDATLIKYPFPLIAITEEQFELTNNWNWADRTSTHVIRDAGWALKNSAGVSKQEWMNITTLGSFNSSLDRAYYVNTTPTSSALPSGFYFSNNVNEAVQIYAVAGHENGPVPGVGGGSAGYDRRGTFIAFLREEQKTYDSYDLLTEQGLSTLTYKKYALPLANAADTVKVTHTDVQIEADDANYRNISIIYFPEAPYVKSIGGANYNFHVVINGDNQSSEEIYEKVQYLLRQGTDIAGVAGADSINGFRVPESFIRDYPAVASALDSSAAYPIRGDIAGELLEFIGDTLQTKLVDGWGGTYIENFNTDDINNLRFADDSFTTTYVEYPFTATGNLLFNDNLVNDTDAKYWMFFTAIGTSAYGTADAILVQDTNSRQISGSVDSASIAFTFDYDNNDQPHGDPDSRTPGTNAAVTVVAIGLSTAQFVKTTSTITRSTGNNISLVAALERNYSNPV